MPNEFSCPTEKGYIPHDTACYKIFPDALIGHDQAKTNCQADKEGNMVYAGLATIWDVHDNKLLQSMILENDENSQKKYWIGKNLVSEFSDRGFKFLFMHNILVQNNLNIGQDIMLLPISLR